MELGKYMSVVATGYMGPLRFIAHILNKIYIFPRYFPGTPLLQICLWQDRLKEAGSSKWWQSFPHSLHYFWVGHHIQTDENVEESWAKRVANSLQLWSTLGFLYVFGNKPWALKFQGPHFFSYSHFCSLWFSSLCAGKEYQQTYQPRRLSYSTWGWLQSTDTQEGKQRRVEIE